MRILVCEPSESINNAICYKLTRDGFEVLSVLDGVLAIELLQDIAVDVIITELLLPYYTGFELIEYVRKKMRLSIPIIVVSQLNNEETIYQTFRLGANDYIIKPFDPEVLKKHIEIISH